MNKKIKSLLYLAVIGIILSISGVLFCNSSIAKADVESERNNVESNNNSKEIIYCKDIEINTKATKEQIKAIDVLVDSINDPNLTIEKDVTSDNFDGALVAYMKEHANEINPDNPLAMVHQFYEAYNLDSK